jgi:hypothetical protein
MMNNKRAKNENGSVFVYILIGIALFAALSYALTQSLRVTTDSKGMGTGATEKNSLAAADMMQFLEAVKMRVYDLTTNQNIPEGKLDFKNDVYKLSGGGAITANNNATCGGLATCSVFSPYGTDGLIPMTFPNASDSVEQTGGTIPKNGHGRVGEINISSVGTAYPELVFIIQGIKPEACNLYNQRQGITTNYDQTTTLTSIGESSSNSVPAAFNGYTTTNIFGDGATIFKGKKSFCAPALSDASDHRLAIWQVLKVR